MPVDTCRNFTIQPDITIGVLFKIVIFLTRYIAQLLISLLNLTINNPLILILQNKTAKFCVNDANDHVFNEYFVEKNLPSKNVIENYLFYRFTHRLCFRIQYLKMTTLVVKEMFKSRQTKIIFIVRVAKLCCLRA